MTVALVTGASSGIGLATAVTLARAGRQVVAGVRSREGAERLQAAMRAEGLVATTVMLDVDSDASVEGAIAGVEREHGEIGVLVNNAGLGGGGAVESASLASFSELMNTNFFGALRCIKAVLPVMLRRREGAIVNVSSVSGRLVLAGNAAYSASKFALEAMSEALAQETVSRNIRVALVEPGVIVTPIFSKGAAAGDPYVLRLGAIYRASLRAGTSPYLVARCIEEIVGGRKAGMRHLVGPDAPRLIAWREQHSDEQWLDLAALDDTEWARRAGAALSLDLQSA